jgi:hypothetical protein
MSREYRRLSPRATFAMSSSEPWAYAGGVSFEGTIVALRWLMADAIAEDRDE